MAGRGVSGDGEGGGGVYVLFSLFLFMNKTSESWEQRENSFFGSMRIAVGRVINERDRTRTDPY